MCIQPIVLDSSKCLNRKPRFMSAMRPSAVIISIMESEVNLTTKNLKSGNFSVFYCLKRSKMNVDKREDENRHMWSNLRNGQGRSNGTSV